MASAVGYGMEAHKSLFIVDCAVNMNPPTESEAIYIARYSKSTLAKSRALK